MYIPKVCLCVLDEQQRTYRSIDRLPVSHDRSIDFNGFFYVGGRACGLLMVW